MRKVLIALLSVVCVFAASATLFTSTTHTASADYGWNASDYNPIPNTTWRSQLVKTTATSYGNARLNLIYITTGGTFIAFGGSIAPSYYTPSDSYFYTRYFYFSDSDIANNFNNSNLASSGYKLFGTPGKNGADILDFCTVYYSDYTKKQGFDGYVDPERPDDHYTVLNYKEDTGEYYFLAAVLLETTTSAVNITKGTGIKDVYLSTNQNATSGSASGSQFNQNSTVYGFAKLDKGYSAKSGWTLVSGTANQEDAIYRVGSKTVGTSTVDFGTISADATSYTISYTLNDGTLPSGYPTSYTITTNTFSLSNPTRTGYTFAGWTGSNGNEKQTSVSIAKGSTGDKSYTANWTANSYTVTLNKNNGTGGSNSVYATYGSTMPSATMPTRTGYTFSGYFDSNNVKYYNANGTSAKNWDKAGTATLTAQWQINQYPVSCPANTDHASYFVSPNANATSGSASGNFDYNSTVYFYVVADEGYYKPDGSSWQKTGTSGDKIVYRVNSLIVSTDTNEFAAENPQRGADIVASATGYNAPFDKGSHSISVNVTTPASDYVIKYKVGSGNYSTTNPQYTNVCDVAVEYKVTADGYYPFFGGATIKITQQQNVSYTTAPSKNENLIYNGSAQALLTAGTSNYGTVQYKVGDEGEWTSIVPQVQNVGEYVVYYCVPEDANQVGIAESSFTVSIAEVNKDELFDIISIVDDYYDTIIDGYSSIAAVLDGHRQQIYNDYYANPNVTEAQVADAVVALNGYLDDAKKSVSEAKIDAIGTVYYTPDKKALIDDAKNYFDNVLNDTQRNLVDNDKKTALQNAIDLYNDIDAVVRQINDIGASEDTAAFRQAVLNARDAYDDLGADRKAIFPADVLKILTDDEAIIPVMDLIDAIGDVKYTPDCKDKIDAANTAYNNLEADQKPLVANYPKLIQANTDYDKVDETVAKTLLIGDVEYTPEIKELISDAKDTYDALSPYQKSIFPEDLLKILIDDVKAYDSMNKIRAIGTIENTTTCKGKIVEARTSYDALTADQKAFVAQSFVKELEDAEAAFNAVDKVNSIGKVKYHNDSKALIERARATYEALTAEQKSMIPVSVFNALETAETTYETIEKNAKTVSLVMNIVSSVTLVAGIIVLILLLRKRKNDKKDDGTKLMSVSALPLLLANNHYFDAPFIILYVLATLAVAVWVANLVLFLQNRKNGNKEVIEDEEPAEEDLIDPTYEEIVSDALEGEDYEDAETRTITEVNGAIFRIRYLKSFTAKLIQSTDETKGFYGELKNEILSYAKTASRISWQFESVFSGRKSLLKFGVRRKTLCVYFAMDVKDLKATKYKVELCESKKYAAVPCMYRIKNAHRCELAKELIAKVAEKFGLVKGERQTAEYSFPYEDNDALLVKGLIKEVKTQFAKTEPLGDAAVHSVSVSEADAKMSDEVAATYIENDVDGKTHKGKKGIINIDVLSANFNDGDTVDIEALWAKKLIPSGVGQVKLLAKGTLDKVLNVDLQDYSIQAVKMIVLVGGTVHKAK